jgi:hypothetical protein
MTTSIKEMRIVVFSAILATACVAYVALAEAQQPCGDVAVATVTAPGKVAAERVLQITASVEAIAAASRTVTVKGPTGDILTIAVRSEVQNFDQIRVGDFVVVSYIESRRAKPRAWMRGFGVAEPTMSASMSTDVRLLQTHMVVLAPARALSRSGSFHPGRTLDLTRLHSEEVYERSIDIQISRLRRRIEVDSSRPKLIKTERGVGYYLDSAVTAIY